MGDLDRTKIQELILTWYKDNGRHQLPWRNTQDVYCITVAEMMLQQTNVPKVIEKYNTFIKKWSCIKNLAYATQKDVVLEWQGLGYNRRAIYLHKIAQIVMIEYGGVFPRNSEELESLPGIGPYTSRSILIFAYNAPIATCDVNINRLVRRLNGKKKMSDQKLMQLAEYLLPQKYSRDWHNALMDIASTICTKRSAHCTECPLYDNCRSFPNPDDYVKNVKREVGRSEQGKHIPRRIYRGRIVEYLRKRNGTVNDIGNAIKKDWNNEHDVKWLTKILYTLEKEDMIVCKNNIWMLQ